MEKIKSTGGSTSYYDLDPADKSINDIIDRLGMSFNRGNIFKACVRIGRKDGVDELYDIEKLIYFAHQLKASYLKGHKI